MFILLCQPTLRCRLRPHASPPTPLPLLCQAKAAGYAADLKSAGFTIDEARAAGCSIEQVKEAGYVEGIAAAGYTIDECCDAIFSCEQVTL